MSENGLLNDYQAVIDFWSELDSNYTELADSFSYVVEGTVVGMPLDLYDESQFCMRQPFSFTKNCEPMCIIFQNCEISDNFLCPNEDIKLLMNTCCSLWNDAFECDVQQPLPDPTHYRTQPNHHNYRRKSLHNH